MTNFFFLFYFSACVWQGRDCRLVLHYEDGLTLMANVTMAPSQFNGPLAPSVPQIYWRNPFESIKSTGDDGQRFFWIDFGGEVGEQVNFFKREKNFFQVI